MGTRPIRNVVLAGSLAAASIAMLSGQVRPVPPETVDVRSERVLRVGVELVQVDATVTDILGRHVPDLAASDFEILQDGRPQRITAFAYVRGPALAPIASPGVGVTPPTALAVGQVRRTIAIVVDDLGLSFESTTRVREMLRHFLAKQMQPGDLVAIVRTSAGSGALQQFTADRRLLETAVERVRWHPFARSAAFLGSTLVDRQAQALRNDVFSVGTLGAIHYTIAGSATLPGRKSVVVLSDGFRLTTDTSRYGRVMESLRAVVDAANRAGVVIYSVDARGLAAGGPAASDRSELETDLRRADLWATQDGLSYLASGTGGEFIQTHNDLSRGVDRVMEDQQGYYVLGYVPAPSTFRAARPQFHHLAVRVKNPGLRVRSRKGFFGTTTPPLTLRTPTSRMLASLMSPTAAGDIQLRLNSVFGNLQGSSPVMLSFMHVDARDLAFATEADGTRSAEIEALAVTVGEDGSVADQNSRKFSFRLEPAAYALALADGFVYRLRVPLKRPGAYHLRIAVRDAASDRIGSASQFIEVPDLSKGVLTLSGLVIGTQAEGALSDADAVVAQNDPSRNLALRRFSQGTATGYFCEIYNARRGRAGELRLDVETRLYRDGAEVFRSGPRPASPPTAGAAVPMASGILQFGPTMSPGSYIFEVAVTDTLAGSRARQWTDFEVVQRR